MPAIRHAEPWAHALRTSVRTSTAEGLSVSEFRGRVRLEVRQPGRPKQTTFLPFDWAKGSVGDVLARALPMSLEIDAKRVVALIPEEPGPICHAAPVCPDCMQQENASITASTLC